MKNFVQYTKGNKSIRLLEITALEQEDPRSNSLAGIAQEQACVSATVQMSRIFKEHVFSWGHEENDGRTWLHGVAAEGKYRSVDSGKETKIRTLRKATIVARSGEETTLESNTDPFELNMAKLGDWKSVHFESDGREVGSIFKNLEEGEKTMEEEQERYYPERWYTDDNNKKGDVVRVFGWYGEPEWVDVELMRYTNLGWYVRRVQK